MGITRRVLTGAAIGGIAGASYAPSVQWGVDSLCTGGLECLGLAFIAIPTLLVGWMLLAWLALHLVGCRPAWAPAVGGPALIVATMILLNVVGVRFHSHTEIVLGCLGAFGYGLAAGLAARAASQRKAPTDT